MIRCRYLMITVLLLVGLVPPAMAQSEPTGTEKALEQLRKALESDETLSPATRKAFQDFAAAMQAELAGKRDAADTPTAAAPPAHETIVSVVDERLNERRGTDRAVD